MIMNNEDEYDVLLKKLRSKDELLKELKAFDSSTIYNENTGDYWIDIGRVDEDKIENHMLKIKEIFEKYTIYE
jgi:hypothetical protein